MAKNPTASALQNPGVFAGFRPARAWRKTLVFRHTVQPTPSHKAKPERRFQTEPRPSVQIFPFRGVTPVLTVRHQGHPGHGAGRDLRPRQEHPRPGPERPQGGPGAGGGHATQERLLPRLRPDGVRPGARGQKADDHSGDRPGPRGPVTSSGSTTTPPAQGEMLMREGGPTVGVGRVTVDQTLRFFNGKY